MIAYIVDISILGQAEDSITCPFIKRSCVCVCVCDEVYSFIYLFFGVNCNFFLGIEQNRNTFGIALAFIGRVLKADVSC